MLNQAKKAYQPISLARAIAPVLPTQKIKELLSKPTSESVSFLIVRHPFDRLLSAYRDKMERKNRYYYNLYGKEIVRKYRERGIARFGHKFYQRNMNNGAPMVVPGRKGSEPTFWEFVTAIIEDELMDDHWMPISDLCSFCRKGLNYNVIIKYENMAAEERYLLNRLNVEDLIIPQWENRYPGQPIDQHIRDAYFNLLNEEEINDLFQLYEMDFHLFGYEMDMKYLIRIR
ncbi:carbohydrate sulfotransferase 14 [Eurytemora carolleeae]|uniref:carbohydrate sulfotransferase 14 n=1 Tax=Eurytemora carolleeae TaxID=1294199 RepID=UPI000C756CE5|nr:carbohydrate sulfotransferase 14 [Eurytemora carolleeae]|eukprot:XP_023332202.1 carbohydrate sulfotransferase 14-like [Eurytemora affinis]